MTGAAARDPVTIGPYRLIQRLGEGGMGVVHLALDSDGRAVAIKILRPHVASDEDARNRLGREVETLRRLRDPRVAEVLDADVDGQVPYLVTRFVPGRPLERVIREDGPFSVGATAQLGRDLAGALKLIHAAGVVHRDVKPANVMILDGAPVLIDFGIAHVADESRLTSTGLVMGTPGYLSPELCDGAPVGEATDWWGWGATLAFAVTGRVPFGTGPVEVVLDRVRRGAADLDGVPEPMRSALASALAVDPAARPPADLLLAGLTPSLIDRRDAVTAVVGTSSSSAATEVFASSARTTAYASQAPGSAAPGSSARGPGAAPAAMASSVAADAAGGSGRGSGSSVPAQPSSPAQPRSPSTPAPSTPASTGAAPSELREERSASSRPPSGSVARTVALGVLFAVSALAAVAPGVAVVVAAGGVVALRTLDRSLARFWRRRYERGPRRSDQAVAVLTSPWSLINAVLLSVPALILPSLVGLSAAFLVGRLPHQGAPIGPDSALALALGMAAGLFLVWVGPGGFTVRRSFAELIRVAVPTLQTQRILLASLGLVGVSAILVARQGVHDDTFVDLIRNALRN